MTATNSASVEVETTANAEVVTKYTTAGSIASRVLKGLVAKAIAGESVLSLCEWGDAEMVKATSTVYNKGNVSKGIAFPTSISVNQCVCHNSPLPGSEEAKQILANGDMVKIQVGVQIDGYPVLTAHTLVVGATKENPVTGRQADALQAAYLASEAALRLIRPGKVNITVTDTVQKIGEAFGCRPVEGMLSHQIERNVLDSNKQIILNPTEEQRKSHAKCEFAEHDVFGVDMFMSTGDGKVKTAESRTVVYKKTKVSYQLKMKTSRATFSEVTNKFGPFAFNLRSFEDGTKARLGLIECCKHGLVLPYDVLYEKESESVAQFLFTVLLLPAGPLRVTENLYDPELVKSDKVLEDAEIKALLATSVRPKKNKKKSATATPESKDDE